MLDYTGMLAAIKRFTDLMASFVATAPVTFVGEYKIIGGRTVPDGWLLCDGSAVSRTEYADLFDEIGTVWGEGDGTTTFNLPDARGRTFRGTGTEDPLGMTGGSNSVVIGVANLPEHSHDLGEGVIANTDMKLCTDPPATAEQNASATNNVIGGDTTAGATIFNEVGSLAEGETSYGAITTSVEGQTEVTGQGEALDITPAFLGGKVIIAYRGKRVTAPNRQ